MLTIIILGVILVLGIVLTILDDIFYYTSPFSLSLIYVVCYIFAGIGLSICTMVAIVTNVRLNVDYEKKLYEKQVLEYRIEHYQDDIVGNELLYKDIIEYNNQLRETKRFANSLWTNWFVNYKVAQIDYVEYERN